MPSCSRRRRNGATPVCSSAASKLNLQLVAVRVERELPLAELRRNLRERLLERQRELPLAELLHQRRLLLHDDQLAVVDDADAVGHFLGLVDVVRRQDDRHALVPQPAHERPHVAAQLHVDARGRLVEEQDARLVRERLRDHHAPLHAARERHQDVVAAVPERKVAQHAFDVRGIRRAAEEAAAECRRRPHGLEGLDRELLRHEPDPLARGAVVALDVVAVDQHRARRSAARCRRRC